MTHRAKYACLTAAMFLSLSFTLESRAYAYVDPGSSLLLFQGVSAAVTGALFYFRRRIRLLFGRGNSAPPDAHREQG